MRGKTCYISLFITLLFGALSVVVPAAAIAASSVHTAARSLHTSAGTDAPGHVRLVANNSTNTIYAMANASDATPARTQDVVGITRTIVKMIHVCNGYHANCTDQRTSTTKHPAATSDPIKSRTISCRGLVSYSESVTYVIKNANGHGTHKVSGSINASSSMLSNCAGATAD